MLTIDSVDERFGLKIDDPFHNTIGGFVFGQFGRRPELGDEVQTNGWRFRVSAMDGLRIDRIELIGEEQAEKEAALSESADQPVIGEEVARGPRHVLW